MILLFQSNVVADSSSHFFSENPVVSIAVVVADPIDFECKGIVAAEMNIGSWSMDVPRRWYSLLIFFYAICFCDLYDIISNEVFAFKQQVALFLKPLNWKINVMGMYSIEGWMLVSPLLSDRGTSSWRVFLFWFFRWGFSRIDAQRAIINQC